MTTKITIANDASSNGDVVLNGANTCEGPINNALIRPGESRTLYITSSSMLAVTERWPTAPRVSDDAIITKCADRGEKWAEEFCARNPGVDVDTMRAWFQNAIEAACDVRRERQSDPNSQG